MNNVVFVGGPFDGEVRTVLTLDPIPVYGYRHPRPDLSAGGVAAVLIGYYVHGTGAMRGKMLWRPTDRSESDGA